MALSLAYADQKDRQVTKYDHKRIAEGEHDAEGERLNCRVERYKIKPPINVKVPNDFWPHKLLLENGKLHGNL